ncbi:GNAT family N-acetyltransferase [Bacillus sp. FSL W7-1360]
MNVDAFADVSQAEEMIAFLRSLSEQKRALRYTVWKAPTKEVIGSCGYNEIDVAQGKVEIGYEFAKEHWGHGYAPEAIDALMTYARDHLHVKQVEAKVERENINSIKALQKLNFVYEREVSEEENGKVTVLDVYVRDLRDA